MVASAIKNNNAGNIFQLAFSTAAEALSFAQTVGGTVVVYDPAGTASGNVYTTWATAYAALKQARGFRILALVGASVSMGDIGESIDLSGVWVVGLPGVAGLATLATWTEVTFTGTPPAMITGVTMRLTNTVAPGYTLPAFAFFQLVVGPFASWQVSGGTQPWFGGGAAFFPFVVLAGPSAALSGAYALLVNAAGGFATIYHTASNTAVQSGAVTGAGDVTVQNSGGNSPWQTSMPGFTGALTLFDRVEQLRQFVGQVTCGAGAVTGYAGSNPAALDARQSRVLTGSEQARRLRRLVVNPTQNNAASDTTFQALLGGVVAATVTVPAGSTAVVRSGYLDQAINADDGVDIAVANTAGGVGNTVQFSALLCWE